MAKEKGELRCCLSCGRDTRSVYGLCFQCCPHTPRSRVNHLGKHRGEKSNNQEQMKSVGGMDDVRRSNDDGWFYDDDDE